MKKRITASVVGVAALVLCAAGWAQTANPTPAQTTPPTKVGIINIQAAIAQSNEGQEAAKTLRDKFAPKRAELEKQQKDISDLQQQLRTQEKTLSDEARTKLLRTLDDKTRAFNRTNEDATSEFQQAEQDAINEIGRKMLGVISEYAEKNKYSLVLDVSSPQTPVLYAEAVLDITQEIINLHNQATAKTASGPASAPATPAAQPASATQPPTKPAGSTP